MLNGLESIFGIISTIFVAGIGFGVLTYNINKILKENKLIFKKLNQMETKIESTSSGVKDELQPVILENRSRLNNHEKRIRSIEKLVDVCPTGKIVKDTLKEQNK